MLKTADSEICLMNSKKLGERIRRLRAMKGYSQANIAEDLGITPGAYAKIERGEIDPNTSRLFEIAKSLDVPVTDFFEDKPKTVNEPKHEYGYATKEELSEVVNALVKLTKAVERIEEHFPISKPLVSKKPAAKRKPAKK